MEKKKCCILYSVGLAGLIERPRIQEVSTWTLTQANIDKKSAWR
jgi:hypothetical protein